MNYKNPHSKTFEARFSGASGTFSEISGIFIDNVISSDVVKLCKHLFFRNRDNEHRIGRRQAGKKVLERNL